MNHACIECQRDGAVFLFEDGYRCAGCAVARDFGLLCAFCGKRSNKLATHSTSEGDQVCESCCKGYEVQMHFSEEPEIEAWHEGKASPEFSARVERYWKWLQED